MRIIFLERTNIVKMALAGDGYGGRRPGHARGRIIPSVLLKDCEVLIKEYATIVEGFSVFPRSFPLLHVRYEEMQMNLSGVLGDVGRFLDVPFDDIVESSVEKLAGHGEDLRARITNFKEVFEYMSKSKPCLSPMLASDKAEVFPRCT